jgi:stearoyl-CoA desaturase (delta-9 desaturase)
MPVANRIRLEDGGFIMSTTTQKQPSFCVNAEIVATTPPALPVAPPPAPPTKLLSWLKNVPFVAMHLSCLAVFFVSPDWLALVLFGAFYFVRTFGISAGYHRYFSHRSYKTSRPFQFMMAWLGCAALQKGPLWWAAHHREHHRHTDTPEDPHSPIARSFWWSHIGWVLSANYDETNWPAIKDWAQYPELRWLNRFHWVPGLTLAGLCWLIDGWSGLVWGFLLSTVVLYHTTFAVNSFCHLWGSRRYATTDASRNNLWVALLTLGEGWHNNHHHYQSSANQGFFWWEIDVSYYLIKLLGFAGLVWDIRKPAQHALAATAEQANSPPTEGSEKP